MTTLSNAQLKAELLAKLEPSPCVRNISFTRIDCSTVESLLNMLDEELLALWKGLLYFTYHCVSMYDLETMGAAAHILRARSLNHQMATVLEEHSKWIDNHYTDPFPQLDES